MNNFKFKKNLKKNLANIVFAYIAHAKFQKASFNSNRDIKQNISVETADTAKDPKTIPPAVFQKRAGGKNQ